MSKFDKIFEARETETAEIEKIAPSEPPVKKTANRKAVTKTKEKSASVAVSSVQSSDEARSKGGRPPAKRSDPDFVGLTTYIRRDTHTRAKIELLREGKGRELSQLVEDLIFSWLNSK